MSTSAFLRRAVVLSAAITVTGLATAGLASAHVTANVYGDTPEQGGYGAVVIRVPNEEENAGTTKVEIAFAKEYAISSARTKPVQGWDAKVTMAGDVVEKITWTARPGNEIAAGHTSYQEFEFSAGTLPENTNMLVLPAAQTYSDGKVVNWDQPPTNGEEPEHPAPVVELAKPSGGHGAAAVDEHADETAPAGPASDSTARWLGGAGLVVGALGLGVGIGATMRNRQKTANGAETTESAESTEKTT